MMTGKNRSTGRKNFPRATLSTTNDTHGRAWDKTRTSEAEDED